MKKNNAIMIADTRPSLIGTLLLQIKDTNPELFDEAIIYYENITEKEKKIMSNIMPCRFIKFDYDLPENVKSKPAFVKFSPLMFARYYMFDLLDEYNTITWIDTDVLICGDLSSIIKKAVKTGMSANFEDKKNKSYKYPDYVRTSFAVPLSNYDMNKYNMSSGLITVSRTLKDYNKMTKWCFDKTIEYSDNLIMPDQGVLNILIQEFKINVSCVGENGAYCVYPSYNRDTSKAKIIHSWGARKFWRSWYLFNKYPKWNEYYQKWVNLGGDNIFGEIQPDISIVIPTYKPKSDLFKLVLDDLLVDQVQLHGFQYDNFEIIIVLDGELSEEFEQLLKSYNDPRIVLIHNSERCGIAKSINIGMKRAKGKYIARIDDDDRIASDRLYKQFEYLNNHPEVQLVSSYFRYFGDMNESRITLSGDLCKAWSIFSCPFDHPTIMFRKDFFIKNKLFYDEERSHVEDWELWLRAFDKNMNVGVIPEVLYFHRWYSGQAGQNNKTVTMMRDLVRKNFNKLGIKLTDDELVYLPPWQGKVNDEQYENLKNIFDKAIENNDKLKLYSSKALRKAFDYRLEEGKTGRLSSLIINDPVQSSSPMNQRESKRKRIKRFVLSPVYKPFKRVFYNISSEAVNDNVSYLKQEFQNSSDSVINTFSNISDSTVDTLKSEISENRKRIGYLGDKLYVLDNKYNFIYDNELSNLYNRKKIILIGTSEHSNIGDAGIAIGEYEFVRKYFNDYYLIEVSTYQFDDTFDNICRIINNDDIIMLCGGGNLGNKYIVEEKLRRKVISTFINNKIVILPQTISFDSTKEGQKELSISKDIYTQHGNLILFTRGAISEEFAKNEFKNIKCYKTVDMALNYKFNSCFERSGILCCIRDLNDESGLTKELYNKVFSIAKNYDKSFDQTTNIYNDDIPKKIRRRVVDEQLAIFAKHKVVVTDRLHGLIFALITNTPCVVISTYNHKLREFVDLVKNESIIFIDKDIDSLDDAIKKLINSNKKTIYDFDKDLSKISEIIKK